MPRFIRPFICITALCYVVITGCYGQPSNNEKPVVVSGGESMTRRVPTVPASISFAGEQVPLDRWEVREQLDREITANYFAEGSMYFLLKLSGRFFPMIEAQLKANGIPEDFKYLCVAESNMLNAISKVGATGFWQFMSSTAPAYSLEISATVDERYNVAKSTEAACAYLKRAYQRFGNWTAAAASYNCGIGGYGERATYQGTNNYYELVLPEETQRYIFRILAFKHLMSNKDSLGFDLPAAEQYAPIKTRVINVSSNIPDLNKFARDNGSNYKMLKWLNPWLRARSLRVKSGKTYMIELPST